MLNFFKYLLTLTLFTLVNSEQYTTNKLWKDYVRPEWAGNVTIIYNNDNIISVEGVIIPLSTGDRPDAPAPYNNCTTGNCPPNKKDCYHKGHIMGLRNGGPDLSENIVPQWGRWQTNGGEWYKLETKIQQIALKEYGWDKSKQPGDLKDFDPKNKVVSWEINLIYKDKCGMTLVECDCQPIEYNGDVYTKDKHYHFEIINNGTYSWKFEKIPNDEESNLIPWIFVFIVLSIWICVFLFYKKMKYTREIVLLENN